MQRNEEAIWRNLKELDSLYEISYNPMEGYDYLYIQHKNEDIVIAKGCDELNGLISEY